MVSLAVVTAAVEIDRTKARPIEEFDHYWAHLPTELQALRDSRPSGRITNGREAIPGQFPYHGVLNMEFDLGIGVCGSSILSRNYILTAAHCVDGAHGGWVIVGAHDRLISEPTQQTIPFEVEGVSIHPGYTLDRIRNDIATVRLTSSMEFNDRVQPIRLPSRTDGRTFSGMLGTISGHGRTSDASPDLSPVLRYAINPILTNANCLEQWGNAVQYIEPQNICLSGYAGRSACNSDSGGPLTVQDNGESLQVGVLSFGPLAGCESGIPTVYARVTYYLDWILANSDIEDATVQKLTIENDN